MVHRVKAGKLCGTIAGLPWPQETRREGKRRGGGGGRPEDSAGTEGGWVLWPQGEAFRGELL